MRGIAGLLGWIVVWGFVFVLLNFIMKFINKKYISKLPGDKKKFKDFYLKIMKIVIKFHKPVGIIISLVIIIHLTLMSIYRRISPTGVIAAALLLSVFCLGLYGAYINKNYKGMWLKIHRIFAFMLILAIAVHVI